MHVQERDGRQRCVPAKRIHWATCRHCE